MIFAFIIFDYVNKSTLVAESQSQSADLEQSELTGCCVQNDFKVLYCTV